MRLLSVPVIKRCLIRLALLALLLTVPAGFFSGSTLWAAPAVPPSAPAELPAVCVLDPFMGNLVRFLCGPLMTVKQAASYSEKAQLRLNPAVWRNAPDMPVLALDPAQFDNYNALLPRHRRGKPPANPVYLFPKGVKHTALTDFYDDPANLPYTAQVIAGILTGLLPKQAAYFQRRLGEFTSRLRSMLISGRRQMKGQTVLLWNPVLCEGFLKAWGCNLEFPTDSDRELLGQISYLIRQPKARGLSDLIRRLKRNRVILVTRETPAPELAVLTSVVGAVQVEENPEEDMLYSLHRLILNMGTQKSKVLY